MFRARCVKVLIAASAVLSSAACSSPGDGARQGTPHASAPTSAHGPTSIATSKVPTRAQLTRMLIAESDLPAGSLVSSQNTTPRAKVTADDAACQPLVDSLLFTSASAGSPAATVNQVVIATGAGAGAAGVRTALAAYRDRSAALAIDSVQNATKACTAGFSATLNGTRTRFTVAPDNRAGGGQQATGVVLTNTVDGSLESNDVWLVRRGDVVAYFVAEGLHGGSVPLAAMTAVTVPQVRKLL